MIIGHNPSTEDEDNEQAVKDKVAQSGMIVLLTDYVPGKFNTYYAFFDRIGVSGQGPFQYNQIGPYWPIGATPPEVVCDLADEKNVSPHVPNCHPMCQNSVPQLSAISLDRQVEDRGNLGEPLPGRGRAEDGRRIAPDEITLVNGTLLIRHQRAHSMNGRFAPLPAIQLQSVPARGTASVFAALRFGASGALLGLDVYPVEGEIDESVRERLRQAGRTMQLDSRSHDHTLYYAWVLANGRLTPQGGGWVTQPECCNPGPGGGCPPPPAACE